MTNKPTTVQELIDILKTFPPDMPVLVSGYETGYECFYDPGICQDRFRHNLMESSAF